MPDTQEAVKKVQLTTNQICRIFNVGIMTVFLWRKGTPKRTPIPYTQVRRGDRHRVFFDWDEVKVWARENGVKVVKYPSDIVLSKKK